MKPKSSFFKVISWALIFSFSYSQLCYALTPRELLEQAKASFGFMSEDHHQGGGSSPAVLAQSQTQAQSAVDQQNNLQDLQNLNFSLTTQNGDTLSYVNNTLSRITRPDGTTLNNVSQDSSGNITGANLRLNDGTVQVLQNGNILGSQTPDGTQVFYDIQTGKVQRTVSSNGEETTYTYSNGETILNNAHFQTTYDSSSKIKHILDKQSGKQSFFQNGMLQRITQSDGSELLFSPTSQADGTLVTAFEYTDSNHNTFTFSQNSISQITLPDQTLLQGTTWNSDGSLNRAHYLDLNQNEYFYENGTLSSIQTHDGLHLESIIFDASNHLSSATWTDSNGTLFNFNQGQISQGTFSNGSVLDQITWNGSSLLNARFTDSLGNRTFYTNNQVQRIELSGNSGTLTNLSFNTDGSVNHAALTNAEGVFHYEQGIVTDITLLNGNHLTGIVWGSDGKIKDTTMTFPNGSRGVYQSRKLVQITDSANIVTNFSYTADRIISSSNGVSSEYLLDGSLVKTTDSQGSQSFYFTSGPQKGFKEKDIDRSGNIFIYEYSSNNTLVQRRQLLRTEETITTFTGQSTLMARNNPYLGFEVSFDEGADSRGVVLESQGSYPSLRVKLIPGQDAQISTNYGSFQSLGVRIDQSSSYKVEVQMTSTNIQIFVYKSSGPRPQNPTKIIQQRNWSARFEIKATNAQISLDARSSGSYRRDTQIEDRQNLYRTGSPIERVEFRLDSNTQNRPSIQLNAEQKDSSNRRRSYSLDYSSGKWRIQASGFGIRSQNLTVNQNLQSGVDYVAELRFENNVLNFYVYQRGQQRPLVPTAVLNALPNAAVRFSSDFGRAEGHAQILYNVQTPTLQSVQAKALPQGMDLISISQPVLNATQSSLSFVQASLSGNPFSLTNPSFSLENRTLAITKPSENILEAVTPVESILYSSQGQIHQIKKQDDSTLIFNNGSLSQILDPQGNPTTLLSSESTLGNVLSTTLTQDSVQSRYSAEGELEEVVVGDMTVHYAANQTIDYLEKSDGTEIHDITFDANGQIQNASVYLPDGRIKFYENGHLVRSQEADHSQLFFVNDQAVQMITAQNLTYDFSYTPGHIEAVLNTSNIPIPDALTPVRMQYDSNFNLQRIVRQNNEIINFTNNQVQSVQVPSQSPQTVVQLTDGYKVLQDNTETFYDANNQIQKVLIHATVDNPRELEVLYQYGKIRQIKKDNVLTFTYSYTFENSKEQTLIHDLEENSTKTYEDGLLLTSFDNDTSVLSTYSYVSSPQSLSGDQNDSRLRGNDRVASVLVSRLGRTLHTYNYAYANNQTLVTDEEGILRTYDSNNKLIFLDKENKRFTYTYHTDATTHEEIIEEKLIRQTLEGGAVVDYDGDGQIQKIQNSDGTFIDHVVLDGQRNIQKATIHLLDGTQKVFSGTQILEEITPQNTHFYFDEGRITKFIDAQGREFNYSYAENSSGAVTGINLNVGSAHLEYDVHGNLKDLKLDGVLSPEEVAAQTTHTYSGGSEQTASTDGDFNTAQYATGYRQFDRNQGSVSATITAIDTFPTPQTITQLRYRMSTYGAGGGDYSGNNHASGTSDIELQYQSGNQNVWLTVPGTTSGLGDTGIRTVNVELQNVTAIRAYASGYGEGSDHGFAQAGAYIYELQYTLADLSQLNFQQNSNGYSFSGYQGSLNFNSQGTLLSASSNLSTQAQSLAGVIQNLNTLPNLSRMNYSQAFDSNYNGTFNFGQLSGLSSPNSQNPNITVQNNLIKQVTESTGQRKDYTYQRDINSALTGITVTEGNTQMHYSADGVLNGVRFLSMPNTIDKSQNIQDASAGNLAITSSGSAGLDIDQQGFFGNASGLFDGTTSYLSLNQNPAFNFGTGSFTIETRLFMPSLPPNNSEYMILDNGGTQGVKLGISNTNGLYQIHLVIAGTNYALNFVPQANAWQHLAIVRSNGVVKVFADGYQIGTDIQNAANISNLSQGLRIGNSFSGNQFFKGNLDELRISNVARYSQNFTTNTEAHRSDFSTSLLLHFDGTDYSNFSIRKDGASFIFDGANNQTYTVPSNPDGTVTINPSFITQSRDAVQRVNFSINPLEQSPSQRFGDGHDGSVTPLSNTTLTRDMYYDNLTINPGITLNPNGYKIFVKGTLTNNGTISVQGGNGSSGQGAYKPGDGDTSPGSGGGAGQPVTTQIKSLGSSVSGGSGGSGGHGGGGGAGQNGQSVAQSLGGPGGGNGGTVQNYSIQALNPDVFSNQTILTLQGGASGQGGAGGGGQNYTGSGGGGGGGAAGGGVIAIYAQNILNQNGIITANGGNGGTGGGGQGEAYYDGRGDGGSGGSGGGGGTIFLVYDQIQDGTITSSGGQGGNGVGGSRGATGSNGQAGQTGTILRYDTASLSPVTLALALPFKAINTALTRANETLQGWMSSVTQANLSSQDVVSQEYSASGILEDQVHADGTVTIFENNKPSMVLDKEGLVLIQYTYDSEGHPTRVYLKNARNALPDEIAKARQKIEDQRANDLRNLAIQKNLSYQSIQTQAAAQRAQLESQLSQMEDQFNHISGIEVKGKAQRVQKANALEQVGNAVSQINQALTDLSLQEGSAYANLDSQVLFLSNKIEADTQTAITNLRIQEDQLKIEILRQEVSPIVYDNYRRILGRDPSSSEYNFWIGQIDYATGESLQEVKTLQGINLTTALNAHLLALPELAQRQAYVNSIKQSVTTEINQYLNLSAEDKLLFLQSLGLSATDAINLTNSDAQKVLSWLNTRSLHFGQSAFLSLEALLDQNHIAFQREDIARKAILIDILSGIISPLDDGDLVISLFALNKVAGLYGLSLSGANLNWNDLQSIYNSNPSSKIIAHINSVHYVIITNVTENSVTYIDPSIGKDKENESLTVTKEGFLKLWQGNVTLETQTLNTLPNAQSKVLSAEATQSIRGAFWGSLLNLIGFVVWIINPELGFLLNMIRLAALGASIAEGDWLSGLSSIVSLNFGDLGNAFGTIFKGASTGVTQTISSLGQALNGVGQFFGTIFQSVTGFFGNISQGLNSFLQGSLGISSGIGQRIVETAVGVGINYGVSKGLTAIGVDAQVSGFLGSLTAGAIIGGMKDETMAGGHVAVTHAQNIQASVQQVLTISNVGQLGAELHLDPTLTSIVGLSLGAIQGHIITNPGSNLEYAFSEIRPNLYSSLAQYGVSEIAQGFGFDSNLSSIFTIPVASGISAQLAGQNVITSINQGIQQGVASISLEYLTQQADLSPLIGSLTSRAITSAIAGAVSPNHDIFGSMYQGFISSALNVARLGVSGTDSWSQAQYLQRVQDFSSIIQRDGLAQALNTYATGIFHQDSINSILQTFQSVGAYIQNAMNQNQTQRVQVGNSFFKDLEINSTTRLRFTDNLDDLVGIQRGAEIVEGSFGSVDGEFGLITGSYRSTIGDEFDSYEQFQRIEDGQQSYVEIKNSQGQPVLIVAPRELGGFNVYNSFGDYVDAVIQNPSVNSSYALRDSNLINERVNLSVFFGGQNLNLNDYFEFDITTGSIRFNVESLRPVSPSGAPINISGNGELQNYISNFFLPAAFAQEDEVKVQDAQVIFQSMFQTITSDPDYIHARDQGNVQAIDFLWDQAKIQSNGNTELALEYFANLMNFKDKNFPESNADRLRRLQNIPSALDGQFQNLVDGYDNRDKLQHFGVSAMIDYKYGRSFAEFLGFGNEVRDELKEAKTQYIDPGYHNNGGFSSADMTANHQGQDFAELLRSNPNAKPSDVLD